MIRSLLLLLILCPSWLLGQQYYEKGLTLYEEGKPKLALKVWQQELAKPDSVTKDPRCAFEYIRVVQEEKLSLYNNVASTFYLKAWKNIDIYQYSDAYAEEINRLSPLLDEQEFNDWKRSLEIKNPELGSMVYGFWAAKDPFPATSTNERLIDHWQRIVLAREKFRRNSSSVYGTDARGVIYVKYGMPNRVRKINTSVSEVTDPFTNQTITFQPGSMILIQVELWQYRFDESEDYVDFYFGENRDEGNSFNVYENIMDLLPSRGAQLNISAASTAALPQFQLRNLVKLAALEKLGQLDGSFSKTYQQYERELITMGPDAGFISSVTNTLPQYQIKLDNDRRRRNKDIPPYADQQLRNVPQEKVTHSAYRFKRGDRDILLLAMEHDFRPNIARESQIMRMSEIPEQELYVRLQWAGYSNLWEPAFTTIFTQSLSPEKTSIYRNIVADLDTLSPKLVFTGELYNAARLQKSGDIQSADEMIQRTLVSSTGKVDMEIPGRLSDSAFEVSDVLVGKSQPVEDQIPPFRPMINPVFRVNEEAVFYFEVYNEWADPYEMEYLFSKKRLVGRAKLRDTRVRVSYPGIKGEDRQYFYYTFRNFEPGDYILELQLISDKGQTVSREMVITLLPGSDSGMAD